jgi:hypothetical protein
MPTACAAGTFGPHSTLHVRGSIVKLKFILAAVAQVMSFGAQAAIVTSEFLPLGGSSWLATITVENDANSTPFSEFTVYFSEATSANLELVASPSSWDTIVIQPDSAIPAAGFLDGLVADPSDALQLGEASPQFQVKFDLLTGGVPGALPFEIYDSNFTLLEFGSSVATVTTGIPEPSSVALAIGALFLVHLVATTKRHRQGCATC